MASINLESFLRAAANGQQAVVSGEGDVASVVQAERSVWGRTAMFLSNIPLLKNIGAVKEYAEKVNTENREALHVFVNTLAKTYGTRGATAAWESVGLDSTKPLTSRSINSMIGLASGFAGEGNAKGLDREIVARFWAGKDFNGTNLGQAAGQPGHAAIDLKDLRNQKPARHVYVSWVPRKTHPGEAPIRARKGDFFGAILADVRHHVNHYRNYAADKAYETSPTAPPKLDGGETAREVLRKYNLLTAEQKSEFIAEQQSYFTAEQISALTPEERSELTAAHISRIDAAEISKLTAAEISTFPAEQVKKVTATQFSKLSAKQISELDALAKIFPRANQKRVRLKNGMHRYETSCQKVHFPLIGFATRIKSDNVVREESQFMLFGLNGPKIEIDAALAKSDSQAAGYFQISTKDNCASMVLRMLDAGGSRNFVDRKEAYLYESVNGAHAYAKRVQTTIDELNTKADQISAAAKRLAVERIHTSDYAEGHVGTQGAEEQKIVARLDSTMDANFPDDKDSVDALTRKAKSLVQNAHALLKEGPSDSDSISALMQANSLIMVCGKLMQERISEQEAQMGHQGPAATNAQLA